MSDLVKVGLDFGTHQTKICVQRVPDEGHGEPKYEFFQFEDLNGKKSYFLPSIIQINDDNTLSYGFVHPEREKRDIPLPEKEKVIFDDFPPEEDAKKLLNKYKCERDSENELSTLIKALQIKKKKDREIYQENIRKAEDNYAEAIASYVKLSAGMPMLIEKSVPYFSSNLKIT